MNLSKRSVDKELFSGERSSKENTMNLSKRSVDKELFSGTLVKENTSITIITISLILLEILFKINVLLIQFLILKTSVLNSFSPF